MGLQSWAIVDKNDKNVSKMKERVLYFKYQLFIDHPNFKGFDMI